jgi:propionyl-CoA carboxylase alpha chain
VRNDTGVTEGGEISMFYDPLIAKLVTHAATREVAIDAQADALDAFYIDGIQHNIPFLAALMQHPRWRSGKISTGFITEEFPDGFKPRTPGRVELEILAAIAAAIDHLGNQRRREITQQMGGNPVRFAKRRMVRIGKESQIPLEVAGDLGGPTFVTYLEPEAGAGAEKRGRTVELVSAWWPGEPVWAGRIGGRDVRVQVRPILNGHHLAYRGISAPVHVYTTREAALVASMPEKAAADLSKYLLCPMPGLVKAIHVAAGQEVKAGDALAVVEAMKMENILRAERDGRVATVRARPGDTLAVDAVILELA